MEYGIKKGETLRGPATIRILKNTVQVEMLNDDKEGAFNAGKVYEVLKTDAPEVLYPGDFWVALNGKGTMLYSASPIEGDYMFRFKQWRAKPDEVPEPRFDAGGKKVTTKEGKTFTTRPSMSMDAVCEIVAGKYPGLTCMAMLPYTFEADDDGYAKPVATQAQIEKLKAWDRAVGLDDKRFAYEKNLLPTLGAAILKEDRVFQGAVIGGLIKTVSLPVDGYTPPKIKGAKKTAAKTAAKKTAAKRK